MNRAGSNKANAGLASAFCCVQLLSKQFYVQLRWLARDQISHKHSYEARAEDALLRSPVRIKNATAGVIASARSQLSLGSTVIETTVRTLDTIQCIISSRMTSEVAGHGRLWGAHRAGPPDSVG